MENRRLDLATLLHTILRGERPKNYYIEDVYYRRVISTYDWQILSDEDKQNKRKGALSLGEKWAASPSFGAPVTVLNERGYHYLYVEVYDAIIPLLSILEHLNKGGTDGDIRLLRLECLLRMEKDLINEVFMPRQHLPDYLFLEIRKELQSDLEAFGLSAFNDFADLYSEMYQLWPQKPDIRYDDNL